jgi:hypothetical protein
MLILRQIQQKWSSKNVWAVVDTGSGMLYEKGSSTSRRWGTLRGSCVRILSCTAGLNEVLEGVSGRITGPERFCATSGQHVFWFDPRNF